MANSPAPAPAFAPVQRNQPAHEVRLGTVKAAIWQNDTDAGVRYNVTFERLYNQEGEWRSTGSFGRDDLLLLAKVADLAHSWILEPDAAEAAPQRTGRNTAPELTGKSLPKRPSAAKAGE